jgi:hypothetical protein
MLDSPQTALETVQPTRTQTGLRVKACILDTVYELGRECSDTFRDIKDKFIRHIGLIASTGITAYEHKTGSDMLEGRARDTAKEIADVLKKRLQEQGWI